MAFFKKLIGRKSKSDIKEAVTDENDSVVTVGNVNFESNSGKRLNSLSAINFLDTQGSRSGRKNKKNIKIVEVSSESDDYDDNNDNDGGETSEDFDEQIAENRKQKLKAQIDKLRKQRDKLRRRQTDMLSIEREIREVISLTRTAKLQSAALKEDLLNKKCELKFLASEVPEGYEIEAKKKEPVFYKKYLNVKTAMEASDLLANVRQKLKALQYIELLTYNKYLECKHETKSSSVMHRSTTLSKHKKRHFGPLMDAMQFANAEKSSSPSSNSAETVADDNGLQKFATVTIEPFISQVVSSTPPVQGPLLPAHYIRGPLSLTSSANMTPESII